MQSRGGGWASYDVDNTSRLVARLPFCDFGEATDPPSADVTAHVVELLAHEGMADHPQVRRAVAWLLSTQEPDGSWFGRWGCNHIYGTGAVVPALVAAGVSSSSRALRRAVRWLVRHQNHDGGWGEDMRSYDEVSRRGRGASTPSQTAWALLALHAAGVALADDAAQRGLSWLVKNQRMDGTWDEEFHTGTGFPHDFSMGYPMYRQVFPVMALGRYLNAGPVDDVVNTGSADLETTWQA
jgi:squalene-hopene/tetraprenyl-beta-curcumene cyclase